MSLQLILLKPLLQALWEPEAHRRAHRISLVHSPPLRSSSTCNPVSLLSTARLASHVTEKKKSVQKTPLASPPCALPALLLLWVSSPCSSPNQSLHAGAATTKPHTRWLKKSAVEAGKSKVKVLARSVPGKGHFPGVRTVTFSLLSPGRETSSSVASSSLEGPQL